MITTIKIDSVADYVLFNVNLTLFDNAPELLPKNIRKKYEKSGISTSSIFCECSVPDSEIAKAEILIEGMLKWAAGTHIYPTFGKTQKESDVMMSFYFGLGKCKNRTEEKEFLKKYGVKYED